MKFSHTMAFEHFPFMVHRTPRVMRHVGGVVTLLVLQGHHGGRTGDENLVVNTTAFPTRSPANPFRPPQHGSWAVHRSCLGWAAPQSVVDKPGTERRRQARNRASSTSPEQSVVDKKETLAARYRNQAGHVLLAARFRTNSGRLLAIFSNSLAVGSMWVPIQGQTTSLDEAKALCVWCNCTLRTLGFLMRRGTILTNPSFSQAELATLRLSFRGAR